MIYFTPDAWLSDLFNKPVYSIDGNLLGLKKNDFPKESVFIQAKVLTEDAETLIHLQSFGFSVIDCNISLELAKDGFPSLIFDRELIRFSQKGDEGEVRRLAGNIFSQNRFHRDPKISNNLASRIKEEWASNYFHNKRGDWMVIFKDEYGIGGFLQLIKSSEDIIDIDLIAVSKRLQRRGIARSMISFALKNCSAKSVVVRVGTQLSNPASIALYQNLGFKINSAAYQLHFHK